MAYRSILIHLAVQCILMGCSSSETIPEIAFELQKQGTKWTLLLLNRIENKQFGERFLVVEEQPVVITAYNTSSIDNLNVHIRTLNEYDMDKRLRVKEIVPGKNCIQTYPSRPISRDKIGEWAVCLSENMVGLFCGIIGIHLRPSKEISSISLKNTPLSTRIANYTIKDFDGFVCLVYNDNQFSELTCSSAQDTAESIQWIGGETPDFSVIGEKYLHFATTLNAKQDGTYFDCIETYFHKNSRGVYKDYTIVRIFLINNGSGKYNSIVKPKSNDDHEGCLKYVNDLYGPNYKYQTDHPNWKSGVIIFVVVISLLAFAFLIVKYFNHKKNKNEQRRKKERTTGVISKNEPNEAVRHARRSNTSDHLYCYINESRTPTLENQRLGPRLGGHRETNNVNRPNKKPVKISFPRLNSAEVVAGKNDSPEIDNELYSYTYADRFDILSALRSQM